MYKLYNEYDELIRVVKHKEEADHFVNDYGWTKKFFKQENKTKEVLQHMEEAPL
jgi:hypothetical protein